MRRIIFLPKALEQYTEWAKQDKIIFDKISKLIDEIEKNPFYGIGKPEPLKYQLKGYWSRRITQEHRLVYKATPDFIIIVSCRYHY